MNFVSAGGLAVAYLQAQLPTVPTNNIRAAVSLEWVVKNPLHKSVNVIFFDDVPGNEARRGVSQLSDQYWLMVVTWQNVADAGVTALNEAGELVGSVLQTLQGWPPSAQHLPFERKKCPYRKTDRDGFTHFPLLFSTRIETQGNYKPYFTR